MLLVAINLAQKGSSVLLIDKEKNFGGCWKTHSNNNLKFESSSHLIEKYPGVYKILEEYSSVKFIPLKKIPIRVFENGLIISYQNKIILLLTFIKLIVGYIYFKIILLIKKNKVEEKINYNIKLKDFIKYKSKNFLENDILFGPKNGYAELVGNLLKRCKKENVIFKTEEVVRIEYHKNKWMVGLSNKEFYICKKLHTTSAINLKEISPRVFKIFKADYYKRKSVLISIKKKYMLTNQSYVSFIGDRYISRINRIDNKIKSKKIIYFLVEMRRNNYLKPEELKFLIKERLLKSKLIYQYSEFDILEIFTSKYTKNSDQLLIKEMKNFKTYYSNGNLAAGIHAWLSKTNQLKNFIKN